MKIAIIHNQYKLSGGMESYLFSLIKGFTALGDQVHVYVFKQEKTAPKIPGCYVHKKRLLPLPSRWKKYCFLHYWNHHFDPHDFDISLALTPTYGPSIAVCGGVRAGYIQKFPAQKYSQHLFNRIEIAFERQYYQKTRAIMAHSDLVASEIQQYYHIEANKIQLLYPPIDTDTFYPTNTKICIKTRQQFNVGTHKTVFLFPSLGHRHKGLQSLLTAFKQLPSKQYELWVAGRTITQATPEHVKFIGYRHDMRNIYAAADFTILPSDYEAFGLVVVESLQCGTPVIVTKDVGAAKLLAPCDGLILPNNHSDILLSTILELKANHFSVTPQFALQHGLTIANHITQIKTKFKPC